jgi:hypothetical protein
LSLLLAQIFRSPSITFSSSSKSQVLKGRSSPQALPFYVNFLELNAVFSRGTKIETTSDQLFFLEKVLNGRGSLQASPFSPTYGAQ